MGLVVHNLELLHRAIGFKKRYEGNSFLTKRDSDAMKYNIDSILQARAEAAHRLLMTIPDSDDFRNFTQMYDHHNDMLKILLAIP